MAGGSYTTYIKTQTPNNYAYDEMGNLIRDNADSITSITWNVYGKIQTIQKSNLQPNQQISYTYDASGNVLAIYENGNNAINGGRLSQIEVDLFGSSRLGLWQRNLDVQSLNWSVFETTPMAGTNGGRASSLCRGEQVFELSNHLGNVLATVSDRKLQIQNPANTGQTLYYTADVTSATDYYPFGMMMPGRKFTSSSSGYRYGFNSQERSTEINDNSYTAEFWQYDSRLGRRWNLDPKPTVGISQYSAFANNPIWYVDIKGDTLRGVNNSSANTQLSIIQNTFKGHKDIQDLFKLGKDGLTFNAIDKNAFENAILDKDVDVQNAVIGLFESINNKATQFVSYISTGDLPNKDLASVSGLNPAIVSAVNTQAPTLNDLNTNFGGAMNLAIAGKQSLSIINTSSLFSPLDMFDDKGKNITYSIPLGAVFFHEVLGHGLGGILNTTNQTHIDAIQLENVYYRVMGLNVSRTGAHHPPVATALTPTEMSNVPTYIQGKRLFTMQGMRYDYEKDILRQ